MKKRTNPFAIVKAVDLTEEQIERLWVSQAGKSKDAIFQPNSPVPLLLLGGKGSGKTHWMRYYSYHVQRIRHAKAKKRALEGIQADGYLGIYILLGSFNAERFSGKGQTAERWQAIFDYYFELWVAQELLRTIEEIFTSDRIDHAVEAKICSSILDLFDDLDFSGEVNLHGVRSYLASLQKAIDRETNNVIFSGKLEARILFSPGKLILGIPKILTVQVQQFESLLFCYHLDELENLTEAQQRLINTLVRERKLPVTFRIGGRTWGMKTLKTYADDEENKEGSEFNRVVLDKVLRDEKSKWEEFAYRLVAKRLEAAGLSSEIPMSRASVDQLFESPDLGWGSPFIYERIGSPPASSGDHFDAFKSKLLTGLQTGNVEGLRHHSDLADIIKAVTAHKYPVLEKINMLMVFRAWAKGDNVRAAALEAREKCRHFLETRNESAGYGRVVQHYCSDMLVQLFRQSEKRQSTYYGMKSFVRMSEGLPRTLIVILKNIFAWANYSDEKYDGLITDEDQERGVLEASDWFLGELRKAGKDGSAVQTGIQRLARLFELNRFADKPIECSLITFSIDESQLNPDTKRLLGLAEERSFLIKIARGAIDKNTKARRSKYQLNAMLSPRSSLPIARRGSVQLSAYELEVIFSPDRQDEFAAIERDWSSRMNAPFAGHRRTSKITPERNLDLFEVNE